MSAIRKNIPNAITLGNLLCGCVAIICVFEDRLLLASALVGVALVLDFFDGFTARLLGVSSPIGKDLDSLADLVTFGVVPGMMMFWLLNYNLYLIGPLPAIGGKSAASFELLPSGSEGIMHLKYVALLIPLFSAIRLAVFNNDTRQTESFIGLPTPACAMVICSLPLILQQPGYSTPGGSYMILHPLLLVTLTVLMSVLLVVNLPLFALKFKSFAWAPNRIRYVFLLVSALLLISLGSLSIPLIVGLYILFSIVNNIFLKPRQ